MNSLSDIVLLGAGAVGILPAAKLLTLTDVKLTAAADCRRIERYRRDGIFFNGEKLPLTFISPAEAEAQFPADLIIVATKTTALEEALENVAPLTGKNTIFFPVLNGISAPELISRRFPGNTVLRGFFLGHASVREGNHIRHDGVGCFFCGGEAGAVNKLRELFDRAGIKLEVPADIDHAIWKKFILNVGINQTQAYFNADYGQVQRTPEYLTFCRQLMTEAAAVAAAENISGTGNMIEEGMKVVLTMPPEVKTSMLQDVQSSRPTEIMAFAGTVCAKAAEYGIAVPRNQEVMEEICRRESFWR